MKYAWGLQSLSFGGAVMATVFISHAHADHVLGRKIVALLSSAVGLKPSEFFCSSQDGRGVTPAGRIREEVMKELAASRALIVVLTTDAAASPWVWLEAGSRLGAADKQNPLFVVPSERFQSLLRPVADLRALRLDQEGDLHELVKAVAERVGTRPEDFLTYEPELKELAVTTRRLYSVSRERLGRTAQWLKRNAAMLVLILALGAIAGTGSAAKARGVESTERACTAIVNQQTAALADQYLVLKGRILLDKTGTDNNATVMASRDQAVRDPDKCREPDCTKTNTTTHGQFRISLVKIGVHEKDDIVLSVVKEGFDFFSQDINLDVRAMDAQVEKTVQLSAQAGRGGTP